MARYLMTHSLLSSWLYAMKENPYEDASTERDPYVEFLQVLQREPTITTKAMQKGIDFEDLVTDIVNGTGDPKNRWYDAAQKVAGYVRGGVLQYKARRIITVRDTELVLYGRLDCLKAGGIMDIKFSGSYDRGKYFDSTQHPTYFEIVPEAKSFTYLVSNGSEVWTERYYREESPSIIPTISDFLEWLDALGLAPLYKEKWLAR